MDILTLSPIDQVQHRGHVHVYFCFPLPETASRTSISLHLQHALDKLGVALPFVKGRIVRRKFDENAEEREGLLGVGYNASDQGPQIIVRHLDDDLWDYQRLREQGFYLHGEEADRFKLCGATCPQGCDLSSVLNVQANFIQGGMILCFAFHHTAFDATSCGTLVQLYASLCCDKLDEGLLTKAKTPRLSASHNLPYEAALRLQGRYVRFEKHGTSPKAASEANSGLFRIPKEALEELKATVSVTLLHEKPTAWVSTIDVTAALIWSCVTRARAPLMGKKTNTTLNMAVNARSRVDPPLPEGYLGNCIVGSVIHKPLSTFIERSCLSDLATSIRASYSEINDHLIRAQFTMINAEPDISLLFSEPPAPPSSLLITSWAAVPLYSNFGNILGTAENVSIPTGPGQSGLCVLQPRKPELARSPYSVGVGDLEFYLGLEREAMERLQGDMEWRKWVQQIQG